MLYARAEGSPQEHRREEAMLGEGASKGTGGLIASGSPVTKRRFQQETILTLPLDSLPVLCGIWREMPTSLGPGVLIVRMAMLLSRHPSAGR